jgi:alcohol dehydrogenase YqhD (iron-dependent ADH family)
MENFEFHIPTKIVFGKDTVNETGKHAWNFGKKLLMVYGMESIKKNGTYDKIIKSLKQENFEIIEFSGVKSNPTLSHTKEGIKLAKENKVDLILAVGGGSVIDEAKAIAAGALYNGDVWDFYSGDKKIKAALPIVTVLTIPATSSEMNSISVITNTETKRKGGISSPFFYPAVSILDPSITYTIPPDYTAYSSADAVAHLLEGYLTHSDHWSPIQDRYTEGLIKTIMECTDKILKNPSDYEARAIIMWASTLAWNGLSVAGLGDLEVPNHMLGHTLGALFDIPHGATLTIIIPNWMRYMKNKYKKNFIKFAENIFNIKTGDDDLTLELGIIALEEWFKKIKCPVSLSEAGIKNPDLEMMAKNAKTWEIKGYDEKMIVDIYRECL